MGQELNKPIDVPNYSQISVMRDIPTVKISKEDSFVYQMQQQINQIIERSEQQITLLTQQNEQLQANYTKLEELYKIKERELDESKAEATKAKKYNTTMLIVALVSAGIALATLVATVLVAVL